MRSAPLLLVLLLAGCSVHSLLNKIDDESQKTIDTACECSNIFPDKAACEAQFKSFFDLVDRDCLENALDADKDASEATLKCSLDVSKDYNRCLKDKLDCNDPNSFQSCQSILEGQQKCPQLPMAVQTELNACGANQ